MQNQLFAAAVLPPAEALALWRTRTDTPGTDASGTAARVTIDIRSEDMLLSSAEDGPYSIEGGRLPVTLEIAGGRIRFVESRCPEHICEHYGWLSQEIRSDRVHARWCECNGRAAIKNWELIARRILTAN